jgi:hypothetical protein
MPKSVTHVLGKSVTYVPGRTKVLCERGDNFNGGLLPLARIHQRIPALGFGHSQNFRLALDQIRDHAHLVRVIGHHEKIQRSGESGFLTTSAGDLFALGKTIGVGRQQARAGIERKRGMSRGTLVRWCGRLASGLSREVMHDPLFDVEASSARGLIRLV